MGIQMLKLHWKASKWVLLPFLIMAFGLPVWGGRSAWAGINARIGDEVYLLLSGASMTALAYPIVAALVGATLALTAWNWDHAKGHVYPLSLPIDRWRYSTLKFGTGALLLMLPAALVAAGGLFTVAMVELPRGLHVYPLALASQFYLASFTIYGLLFALASGTIRTTVMVISASAVFAFFGDSLMDFTGNFVPGAEQISPIGYAVDMLISDNGPLHVFAGNWMLIDV